MARLVLPWRLEVKSPEGSSNDAPFAKVIFTTDSRMLHGGSFRSRWEFCDDSSEKNGMKTPLLWNQLHG